MSSNVMDACDVHPYVDVRELLVLWQHPDTREIVPVGRLSRDDAGFAFEYTRAASSVADFRPLPGLDDLYARHVRQTLPAIFAQRAMDSDRPDFEGYIASLGLEPATATPWEQIVRSGGNRVGDTLQFMEIPCVVDGVARARFLANGIRHIPNYARSVGGREIVVSQDQHESAMSELVPGSQVNLIAEDANDIDPSATLVSSTGVPVGYVPALLAPSVRRLLGAGDVAAHVVRVNGPETPAHLRLVLDLVHRVPREFTFDVEGRWRPLSR